MMKEINITPSDLREIEREQNKGTNAFDMDGTARTIFDFMHGKKLVTSNLVESKLGIKRRTANEALARLFRANFIKREQATLKTSDGANHICYIYYLRPKENGRKRNNKKV